MPGDYPFFGMFEKDCVNASNEAHLWRSLRRAVLGPERRPTLGGLGEGLRLLLKRPTFGGLGEGLRERP